MERKAERVNYPVMAVFMLIMIALGISDSNRGVFSTVFEKGLNLSKPQVSLIVTVSYLGNLLFMLLGGNAADRFDRKKACMSILGLWTLAQVLFACTDNYVCLLLGMFVSMGASTLMNTMMNILSPLFFGTMAGLYVNVLFFVQGIGTSGNQKITGTLATDYNDYRFLCLGLAAVGMVSLILLGMAKFKSADETKPGDSVSADGVANRERASVGKKGFRAAFNGTVLAMGLVFGFYFVAEHGIMNWWAMYCRQGLGLTGSRASTSVSLFFGTMTLGRLVMAPLVQKLGNRKSIALFGGIGSVLYILGILLGADGTLILGLSGICISVIYPTIVLLLQDIFPGDRIATVTGVVISIGTLFDIAFNAVFGSLVDAAGFSVCRVIFPVAILIFYGGFLIVSKKGNKKSIGR